jgi:Family of unknown function (DUF6328)
MGEDSRERDGGRTGETEKERLDRELMELLNELRVALPGVQVLFAFLLTVPFSQRFPSLTETQRLVFFGAFICGAVSTAFFIAPTAYHRINFRAQNKKRIVFTSNRMALAGTVFLALAIAFVVYLITDLLYDAAWAPVVTGLVAVLYIWLWYALPLLRRGD